MHKNNETIDKIHYNFFGIEQPNFRVFTLKYARLLVGFGTDSCLHHGNYDGFMYS